MTGRFSLPRVEIRQCLSCRSWSAHEKSESSETSSQFYADIDERVYREYFEPFRSGQYRETLARLKARVPQGASLLDVGASYGWLVRVARDLGWNAIGIEPARIQVEASVAEYVLQSTLDDYVTRAKHARADVVTMWHVLEHIPDLVTTMAELRAVCAEGGHLLIAVPNAEGRMFRLAVWLARFGARGLLRELFYLRNPNMHYHYFTPAGLTSLLTRCGFAVEDVFTLEAFDWRRAHMRIGRTIPRGVLRAVGPLIAASNFTGTENLVVLSRSVAA
ncbi:MAG TPA: class I SAM-dependent methyltransferase [Gemmatimonadaceae bacterium]